MIPTHHPSSSRPIHPGPIPAGESLTFLTLEYSTAPAKVHGQSATAPRPTTGRRRRSRHGEGRALPPSDRLGRRDGLRHRRRRPHISTRPSCPLRCASPRRARSTSLHTFSYIARSPSSPFGRSPTHHHLHLHLRSHRYPHHEQSRRATTLTVASIGHC